MTTHIPITELDELHSNLKSTLWEWDVVYEGKKPVGELRHSRECYALNKEAMPWGKQCAKT